MAKMLLQWLWICLKFPAKLSLKVANVIRKQVFGGGVLVKRGDVYYVPIWIPIAFAFVMAIPLVWDDVAGIAKRVVDKVSLTLVHLSSGGGNGEIAEFFAPSVQHWASNISDWADLYEVDTQLMATVMQIESCGHPTVVSHAGANGLFQVMPFHFEAGEDMLDPATNAKRGGMFLNYCHTAAKGDVGLTLACYNGGPSVINRSLSTWASETQRYYMWGVGIYGDAIANRRESDTLNRWMEAGGSRLCASAMSELLTYSPAVAEASS